VRKQAQSRGGKVNEKDITLFTRQLATMMKSGVPLLRAFDIVGKGTDKPSVARLFGDIRADVETGTSLSQAFRRYPLYFDSLFCNLVGAGEQAGILDTVLDRLGIYKEKMLAIKGQIKSALFYPTAVMVVAAVVVTVIMLFVIPAFKSVFENFGADLPTPTLIVIAMSDLFVAYWYILFGAIGGVGYFTLQAWRRSPKIQAAVDRMLLRLPIFGVVIRKATIARWLRTLSTMFAAGVPLVEALDSVGGAAGNKVYLDATRKIQQDVESGISLTQAMTAAKVFPNMVLQMASIGEESGALDAMLGKSADIFEREVDDAVASLSSLLEPLIMAVLGVIIGGLVVAMYLPIF
jgi:type IV pilus assembly protein PilC